MSAKGLAHLYAAGKLRGDRDNFVGPDTANRTLHCDHHGVFLRMHSATPPPAEEYNRWLADWIATSDKHGRGKTPLTGAKLRRIVVMRRQGSSLAECGRAVGVSPKPVLDWLARLPVEMSA